MKVLLVDSSKRSAYSSYVPLALLKLSTKHKLAGDEVKWVKAGQAPLGKFDVIYFSTVFLFNSKKDVGYIRSYAKKYPDSKVKVGGVSATLMASYYKKYCPSNVEIIEGLQPELDAYRPDYDIAGIDFSYGFTSRGCSNKCPWCVVPKVEGKQYTIKDWKQAIDPRFKVFRGMDNNILSCSVGHIGEVFEYLSVNKILVDFNQAMDCQLLMKSEEIQKLFIKYKHIWLDIRFAWDSKRCDKYALATLDFFHEHKIKPKNDFIWYMLYDYTEAPEIVFNRMRAINKHPYYSRIKPMRYKDLTTGGLLRNWGSIGDRWASWLGSTITGIATRSTIDNWLFKHDYNTFNKRVDKLAMVYEKYNNKGVSKLRTEILDGKHSHL